MHIRTKLLGMMFIAALASAALIFGLFYFLQRETNTAAGENLKEIYSQSWYNLYTESLLDLNDLMFEITSFTSVLDVDLKYTEFAEDEFVEYLTPHLESGFISFASYITSAAIIVSYELISFLFSCLTSSSIGIGEEVFSLDK